MASMIQLLLSNKKPSLVQSTLATSLYTSGVTSEGEADIHRILVYELKVNLNYMEIINQLIAVNSHSSDLRVVSLIALLCTTVPKR